MGKGRHILGLLHEEQSPLACYALISKDSQFLLASEVPPCYRSLWIQEKNDLKLYFQTPWQGTSSCWWSENQMPGLWQVLLLAADWQCWRWSISALSYLFSLHLANQSKLLWLKEGRFLSPFVPQDCKEQDKTSKRGSDSPAHGSFKALYILHWPVLIEEFWDP